MKEIKAVLVVLIGLACAFDAEAIDYSRTAPPVGIDDGVVSIGTRTVRLPAGNWTFVSYTQWTITTNISVLVNFPVHTGYFANVKNGEFQMGVVLDLPETAVALNSWWIDSCNRDGNVYKSSLQATPELPECIVINRHSELHRNPTGKIFPLVVEWLDQQKVGRQMPVYDVRFIHTSRTGPGWIRFLIPTSMFRNDQAVIDWAMQLPGDLRPFFQGRSQEAAIHPIPPL